MKFAVLTDFNTSTEVYINPVEVVAFHKHNSATKVWTTARSGESGLHYFVKEEPSVVASILGGVKP